MAVMDRATHTDARHERFHLQTAISKIHLHSFDHSKYSQTQRVTRDRIYILFAPEADTTDMYSVIETSRCLKTF